METRNADHGLPDPTPPGRGRSTDQNTKADSNRAPSSNRRRGNEEQQRFHLNTVDEQFVAVFSLCIKN